MSKHGKIGEFDPEQDNWELYVERMNFYFVANNVTQEGKKKATLLTEMGGKAYQVIRNLLVPSTPGKATFNQIGTLMQEHTKPTPSVIVQRFKFNTRDRQPNESTAEAPLHPWEFPGRPWSRLHIDYAGPVQGKMILVIVDSYSKWNEAHVVTTATATATINKLRLTFTTHGLPDIIVSDNGANFTSEEFAAFMKSNGIKHVRTAPYHHQHRKGRRRGWFRR